MTSHVTQGNRKKNGNVPTEYFIFIIIQKDFWILLWMDVEFLMQCTRVEMIIYNLFVREGSG